MGFFKKLVKGVGKLVSTAASVVGATGILPGSGLIAKAGGMVGKLLGGSPAPIPPNTAQQAQATAFAGLQQGATVQAGPISQAALTSGGISISTGTQKPW